MAIFPEPALKNDMTKFQNSLTFKVFRMSVLKKRNGRNMIFTAVIDDRGLIDSIPQG